MYLAWIWPYGHSERKLSWFLLTFLGCFISSSISVSLPLCSESNPASSHFANPIDSVRQSLCFAAGGSAQTSTILSPDISELTTAQAEWRSCNAHPTLSLPHSHKNKGKIRKDSASTWVVQLWWPNPGKKYWKLPSRDQKNLQKSCCSISSFSLEEQDPCRECAVTPPCSFLSALICNYLFYWIFTYFHVSKSHSLQ